MAQLSNPELLARVMQLARREREATAALIAHLAELDARRLYLAEGCASLFTYCTQLLHLSKRQVEELVARLRPQPPVPSFVRRLPPAGHPTAQPTAPAEAAASSPPAGTGHGVTSAARPALAITPPPACPAVVAPLAPERYKVQFTASAETYEKLRLAQALLRHQIPDRELGTIVDRVLTALVQELTKKKFAATDRPRGSRGTAPNSRHIQAEVKRAVWLRDGGRCTSVPCTPPVVREARASDVHPPSCRPRRRGWLSAATRSGPNPAPGRLSSP